MFCLCANLRGFVYIILSVQNVCILTDYSNKEEFCILLILSLWICLPYRQRTKLSLQKYIYPKRIPYKKLVYEYQILGGGELYKQELPTHT